MTSSFRFKHALCTLTVFWLCAATARGADPGIPIPAGTEAADQKTGSVLIYNFYSSSASSPNTHNSRFTMTNTSTAADAFVHLFFVDGISGQPTDVYICMTPNQTTTFLASDVDPGVRGFMVAVAVEQFTGCPLGFNFLSGDVSVKLATGHEAGLAAVAVAALFSGTLAGCSGVAVTANLAFDGTSYNRLPRMLMADKLRSPGDGNSTQLVLNRIGGSLLTVVNTLGQVSGVLYNDLSAPATFTFSGGPQQSSLLTDSFPLTSPLYTAVIPAGRTGWLKAYTVSDTAMLGAYFNFNAASGSSPSAFVGGHNLRALTLTTAGFLTIPVFAPPC